MPCRSLPRLSSLSSRCSPPSLPGTAGRFRVLSACSCRADSGSCSVPSTSASAASHRRINAFYAIWRWALGPTPPLHRSVRLRSDGFGTWLSRGQTDLALGCRVGRRIWHLVVAWADGFGTWLSRGQTDLALGCRVGRRIWHLVVACVVLPSPPRALLEPACGKELLAMAGRPGHL